MPNAGGLRKSVGMLRSAPEARAFHSSRARLVVEVSKDEPWPKEKINGEGCQGLDLS